MYQVPATVRFTTQRCSLRTKSKKVPEQWGATCQLSLRHRPMSGSAMPLAPHLDRDWASWEGSDNSDGGADDDTLQSLDKYHNKILLCKRPEKTKLIPARNQIVYSSPLHIKSMRTKPTKHTKYVPPNSDHFNDCVEEITSPVAKHKFSSTFSSRRTKGEYQWVAGTVADSPDVDTSSVDDTRAIEVIRIGSRLPNNGHSKRPRTSPITGRAGIKGFFIQSVAEKKEKGRRMMEQGLMTIQTEKIRAVPRNPPTPQPPPPAPSPLLL